MYPFSALLRLHQEFYMASRMKNTLTDFHFRSCIRNYYERSLTSINIAPGFCERGLGSIQTMGTVSACVENLPFLRQSIEGVLAYLLAPSDNPCMRSLPFASWYSPCTLLPHLRLAGMAMLPAFNDRKWGNRTKPIKEQ